MEKAAHQVFSSKETIARSVAPLVAVTASEEAEQLCRINHISSVADLLKPFGDLMEGRVTPRDSQGVPNPIDSFNIRFKHVNKLEEPNHGGIMRLVQNQVKHGAEASNPDLPQVHTRADVTEAYLTTPLDDLTPWYADFKNTVLSQRGITEFETFDHPVAVIIVISSTDPDPVSTIMQLYNPNMPLFATDKPYIDTHILRYFIVLHDPNRTSMEYSTQVFEKLKKTVGIHCHLLNINSKPRKETQLQQDLLDEDDGGIMADESVRQIWERVLPESDRIESEIQKEATADNQLIQTGTASPAHRRSSSTTSNMSSLQSGLMHVSSIQSLPIDAETQEEQADSLQEPVQPRPIVQYGRYMTEQDVQGIKNMVRDFTVQSMLPFMERSIQHWNEQVAAARRGLAGRLMGASRRFFGTNTRSPSPQSVQTISAQGPNVPVGVNTLTIYPFAAPEAQMRKLADYAFMLRDYKFAYTIYDTVRRDFATEKAYKHHAATQEMMGVCLLLMNAPLQNKKDVDSHFELAVQQYLGRCRSPFHATRTTIIYYELLKACRMWNDIPTALVRMTGEDSDLRSGLFLEQAAHCFLRVSKPRVRKYGFHLMMAGHRYGKASQRILAYRDYKMASSVLESGAWSVARSHIQFALGRQAYHLGRLEEAVEHFSSVLADTKQTPQQQVAHIREFLFIYKQYTTQVGIDPLKASLPQLGLPVIDDRDILVTLSNVQSTRHHEEWDSMELELLESGIEKGLISSSKRAMAVKQQDDHRVVCAVGEPSTVHIELYNPLQVAISLSNIVLGCDHRTSIETSEHTGQSDMDENMPEGTPVGSDGLDFDAFQLQKIEEMTLEPLEKRTISLTLIPHLQGSIRVTGLHYTLNELVHTFRPFHKKGKRLNKTMEERMSVVHAPDCSLDILVTSPMPLLDIAFHNAPETLLSGEVVQTVLEINNKGNKGLTALRLKNSHPSFICIGHPEEMDKDIYARKEMATDKTQLSNQLFDASVISIPLPAADQNSGRQVVMPGETTLVPLWIRGDRIGKHTFRLLFSYQSEQDNATIAHRTLRYTLQVQVLPSLKINAFTRPSTTTVNEYILGMEIENLQTVANFELSQLMATSPMWTISPLSMNMDSPEDVQEKTIIAPRQTTFAYYKIRKSDVIDDSCPEAWTSNALTAMLSNGDTKSVSGPPDINLYQTELSFRKGAIPFDTIPLKTFALNSRMHWRQGSLEGQFPNIAKDRYHQLFTLFNSGDVDLTLYWDIPQMQRHGHHYIVGVNLGVQQNPFQGTINPAGQGRTMFEATAKERTALVNSLTRSRVLKDESPVKLMIDTPDHQSHDFDKGLLKVPITLYLQNCSWNRSCQYTLELLPPGQKSNSKSLSIYPFHWTGSTVFTGTLACDEKTEIKAFAAFQLPGVYDVNRWKLTVRTHEREEEVFVHQPSLPQLVTTVNV